MGTASAPGAAALAGDAAKTPVTILTGFLGAGKTTLLNYILKSRNERNISVIENEFGEVNIDNKLVADNLCEAEDLVSLDNGCVCCSLRKDVVKALAEIERRSRHRNKRVHQVILETTGLADPAPVAFTFFANPWIASRFRLDSIVCVCDTRYVLEHLDPDTGLFEPGAINEAAQQLAFADLILLNKTDLVTPEQLENVKRVVREVNQSARQIECRLNQEGGRPPLADILDSNAFSVHKALKVDPYFLDSDSGSDGHSGSDDETASAEGIGEQGQSEDRPEAAAAAAAGAEATMGASPRAAGPSACELKGREAAAAAAAEAKAARGVDQATTGLGPSGTAGAEAGAPGVAAREDDAQSSDATHLQMQQRSSSCQQQQQQTSLKRQRPPSRKRAASAAGGPAAAAGGDCGEPSGAGSLAAAERRPKRRRKQMHDVAGIGSVGIVARGPLDEYRFNMFMRDLLTEKGKDIFRCKGVLAVHGYGSQKFVFQGVHETICYGPGDKPWGEDEPRINQIVFIGRGLNRKSLMMGFKTCVWQPLPDGWREAFDPVTKHPYYYNPVTHQKTWARPREGRMPAAADAVTVTPVVPTQQPRRLLPRRRSMIFGQQGGAGGDAAGAASCASAGDIGAGGRGPQDGGQQAGSPQSTGNDTR